MAEIDEPSAQQTRRRRLWVGRRGFRFNRGAESFRRILGVKANMAGKAIVDWLNHIVRHAEDNCMSHARCDEARCNEAYAIIERQPRPEHSAVSRLRKRREYSQKDAFDSELVPIEPAQIFHEAF